MSTNSLILQNALEKALQNILEKMVEDLILKNPEKTVAEYVKNLKELSESEHSLETLEPSYLTIELEKVVSKHAVFIEDLKKVRESEHSLETLNPIYSTIDLVYVLSGRGSALKKPIDHAVVDDPEDDYYRMLKGIEIANKIYNITGVRVPIFYNGRDLHNKHLRAALDLGVFDYPKELFIIKPIFPDNTIGQAKSFKEFLKKENYSTVAIVSSAYHLPRVCRTFGKDSPTIGDTDLEESTMGTISRYQSNNTFLNKADVLIQSSYNLQLQWSYHLHRQQSKIFQEDCNSRKKAFTY